MSESAKEDACDVSTDIPKDPLPIFGELFNKRHMKRVYNASKACRTGMMMRKREGPPAPKIYRGNDLLYITNEAKNLFRPHGLPQQIAKLPNMVTFSDGLKLREICKQIRDQHWSYICLRKGQFREKVWQMMHVERIPCGNLRESFMYSFQTYLPPKSNFPQIWDNPLPW